MKTKTISPLLFFLLISTHLFSQKEKELPPPSFNVGINYDNMFGFYPGIYGSFGVNENLSFTYYGLLWTNPSFGTPTSGSDNWLETGFGLGIELGDGKWYLNPSLAFTHGKLLSGGAEGVIGDGIAPNLSILYTDDDIELEAFGVWYKALREKGLFTYDYALFWFLPGFIINEHISAGLHFEGFVLTRVTAMDAGQLFQVVGAYTKFTVDNRYSFRLSLGKNFKDTEYPNEFYKVMVTSSPRTSQARCAKTTFASSPAIR